MYSYGIGRVQGRLRMVLEKGFNPEHAGALVYLDESYGLQRPLAGVYLML